MAAPMETGGRKRDKLTVKQRSREVLSIPDVTGADYVRVKVSIDPQGRIVIPSVVREELSIKPHSRFVLIGSSQGILLKKIEEEKEVTAE